MWADNDRRAAGRTVYIESIDYSLDIVLIQVLTDADGTLNPSVGTFRRLSQKRFRPTSRGYRLLGDYAELCEAA